MAHILSADDKWFLDLNRKDALTQETFRLGDSVVVCENCRSVHMSDSWEYCLSNNIPGCCICNHSVMHSFDKSFILPHSSKKKIVIKSNSRKGRSVSVSKRRLRLVSADVGRVLFRIMTVAFVLLLTAALAYLIIYGRFGAFGADFKDTWETGIARAANCFDFTQLKNGFIRLGDKVAELWKNIIDKFDQAFRNVGQLFGIT